MPRWDYHVRLSHALVRIALCEVLFLQLLLVPGQVAAHPNHPGKWTGTMNWSGTAVNLVLLRGDASHHSKILWWDHDSDAPLLGNVYGWDPPDDATTNAGTFPTANFDSLTLDDPPSYHDGPSILFCAGMTVLADGKVLVTGGTSLGEAGNKSGLIFDPAADANGEWTRLDDMFHRRWYPDNTLLPDGRVVTASGSAYVQFVSLGGLAEAATDTTTRMLQRVGVDLPGQQESSVVPLKNDSTRLPLGPVSDAAVASVNTPEMLFFGGRNGTVPSQDAYRVARDRNYFESDYLYLWTQLSQPNPKPDARYGAALVALGSLDTLLLIGGRKTAAMTPDVWRGTITNNVVTWKQLNNYSPTSLPALHGLSAIYDAGTKRVFVFGGSNTTASDAATDSSVYSLELGALPTSDTLLVTLATATGTAPGRRSYASLTHDKVSRKGTPGDSLTSHDRALLFGGYKADGSYSGALYSMWIKSATEVVWEAISPDASPWPAARARHSAAMDGNVDALVVYGGEVAAGLATATGWMFDMTCGGSHNNCATHPNHHWESLPDLTLAVRGAAGTSFGTEPAFSRVPEVFTPGAGTGSQWNSLSNAPHWQEWFPFGFVLPRGAGPDSMRVFYAGPETPSSILTVDRNSNRWTTVPGTGGNFLAGSAVMYRPGKVMKCGTRDTGNIGSDDILGTTSVIDLKAGNPAWVDAPAADTMIHRRNHNLVILPTGEVAVIGGARWGGNDLSTDANCVPRPQIWNPDTLGTEALHTGYWYGSGNDGMRFDSSSVRRHYHGTAVLLPDGRILSASGAYDQSHQVLANIYSPYYLFNSSGGPATRPVIKGVPAAVFYGERFALCMGASDSVLSSFALIRPGATTHAFDQNQRYDTLTFDRTSQTLAGERRFWVTAPADSFDAPPGDYMLFALNPAGTPAVAHWIRIQGRDRNANHPTRVQDLSLVFYSYSSADQGVTLEWTSPVAESLAACAGSASAYHIRYRSSSMSTWAAFAGGTLATGASGPGTPGARDTLRLTGLADGVDVHVRLVSKNDAYTDGNWSAMSNELVFSTPSSGGSEGGGDDPPILPHAVAGAAAVMAPTDDAVITSTFLENTLFADAPSGVVRVDRLPLPNGPRWIGDHAQVRVSRWGTGSLVVKSIRLLAQDHTQGDVFSLDGDPAVGTFAPAASVRDADGVDLGPRLVAGKPYESQKGDVLTVELTGSRALMLRTSGGGPVGEGVSTGIGVQVPDQGGWREVASVVPRELESEAAVSVPAASRYRLVFRGNFRLHAVGAVAAVAGAPSAVAFNPIAATHSGRGEVLAEIAQGGAAIAGGDAVVADFEPTPAPGGVQRDWFMEVTAVQFQGGAHALANGATSSRVEVLPTAWALHAPRPNPFASSVEIPFDVPRRGAVVIEVFDLLGRRVATPANSTYEPGRYSVVWDRIRNDGSRLPAGIYTCRFTAGGKQERRRMIVLP